LNPQKSLEVIFDGIGLFLFSGAPANEAEKV
jgi:hypothetical protein